MAFRRLTLAEKFAFKGATSYRPLLADPTKIGNWTSCSWGFVPQPRLLKAMTKHRRKYQFRVNTDEAGNFYEPQSITESFDRYSIGFPEFKSGATGVYSDITGLFSDSKVDFRDVELVSPRLSLFLNDCLIGYYDEGKVEGAPQIEIDSVDTMVQDINIEFGNIDHYGKYFGQWDGQELRFHLLGGFSPEITTANEYAGDGPQRVVTSVLYECREKVWFDQYEDKPSEWALNRYYFEFESPLRGTTNWRLRNINKAIDPP